MAGKTKKKAEADAAEPDDDVEAAAKPKPKFSRKMIIMAAAAVLVLGGGGAGGYVFFSGHGTKDSKEKPKETAAKPATFVDLPDVLVNLANSGNDRTQYLKVKVVLELPEADLVERIKPLMPRVMDAFQTYLRELRPTDLDGSAGLYRLKEDLTRRVNAVVAPNHITAVLFKEIVVQ
jgi:flagellar FliL protein